MSDEKEAYGSATVTMTIRVTSAGHWGKGATIDEVMRIGARETKEAITKALDDGGLKYETIGEPKIGAITWEMK